MINFEYLIKSGITEYEYLLMVKVFQKDMHLISKDDKESVDKLLEEGYFTLLKTGKTIKDKLRISPKGKSFLEKVSVAKVDDEVIALDKELREIYEGYSKIVGKDVLKKLAWFKDETGFKNSVIISAVRTHLDEDSFTYTLSNLIWKGENIFAAKWDLESSYLFELICKTFNYNRHIFVDKKDKEAHFLLKFGTTLPPKGLPSDWYISGSYEGDVSHITNLAEELTRRLKKT